MLDKKWVKSQISDAHIANPNVTDSVIRFINELFIRQLTEEQLTPTELKNISITLLQEMGFDFIENGHGK
jgi:hypothetical protein